MINTKSYILIYCGDMNVSLLHIRNNSHDGKYKSFVCDNKMIVHLCMNQTPTFHINDVISTSQIDYILSNTDFLEDTIVFHQNPINLSDHLSFKATISATVKQVQTGGKK